MTTELPSPPSSPPSLPRASRRQGILLGLLLSLGILLCGIILGAGGMWIWFRMERSRKDRPPSSFAHLPPEVVVRRMQKRFALTDAEAEKVKEILERWGKEIRQIQNEYRPKLRAIREKMMEEMKATLRPEVFEAWKAAHERRRWKSSSSFLEREASETRDAKPVTK